MNQRGANAAPPMRLGDDEHGEVAIAKFVGDASQEPDDLLLR